MNPPDESSVRQRSARRNRWVVLSALVFISILNSGYRYFCDNHALQLPRVAQILEPGLFPADPFVATLGDYVSWVWWVVAFLARFIDLKIVLFAFFLLTRILLVYSCARLARILVPHSRIAEFVGPSLPALAPRAILADGNLTEVYFEQTSFFIPLFLLALALLLERKPARFYVVWALAFVTNPMYGSWAGLFFAGTYLADPDRPQLSSMLKSAPIFALIIAPNLLHGLRALSQPKPDIDLWNWLIRLLNSPHLAPSTWEAIQYRHFALFVALVLMVSLLVGGSFRRLWLLVTMWSGLAIFFLWLAVVVGDGTRWMEILVLQPARATDFFYMSAGIAVVAVTAELAARRMTTSTLLAFIATYGAVAYLLSPSFRNHALWFYVVLSASAIAGALWWQKRNPASTANLGFKQRAIATLVLVAALLPAMIGQWGWRADILGGLGKALVEGPREEILAIADWARKETPVDATFFHDPITWSWAQFRYLARRPVYTTWKDGSAALWAPLYTREWSRRFAYLEFKGPWRERWDISKPGEIGRIRQSLRQRYRTVTDGEARRLGRRFGVDYWIAPATIHSRYPVVFSTTSYKVLQIQ